MMAEQCSTVEEAIEHESTMGYDVVSLSSEARNQILGKIVQVVNAGRYSRDLSERILAEIVSSFQSLTLLENIQLGALRDTIISHNEIVEVWVTDDTSLPYHEQNTHMLCRREFWRIPARLLNCKVRRIFGAIPEHIDEADSIRIEVFAKEGVTDAEMFS